MKQSELRIRDRYKYNKNILTYECEKKESVLVKKVPCLITVSDVSYGGIGINSSKMLMPDTVLSIRLSNENISREFNVKVKWCKINRFSENYSKYKGGLEFESVTRDDIVFMNKFINEIK